MALAHVYPSWTSVGFSWSVAGRNSEHGERSRHGLDDRRHRTERAAHHVVAKNKSGTARAGGSGCGRHCVHAQVSRGAVPQSNSSRWNLVRVVLLMFPDEHNFACETDCHYYSSY